MPRKPSKRKKKPSPTRGPGAVERSAIYAANALAGVRKRQHRQENDLAERMRKLLLHRDKF